MEYEYFNIFPVTIYIGKMMDHEKHKEDFYKIYPKFDYIEDEKNNTVSENVGNPLIHLEESLDPLFNHIIDHAKTYVSDVLKCKDIFNYVITKTWLSRARDTESQIKWHIHSTSHISFCYYLNMPDNAHSIKFSNPHHTNSLFLAMMVNNEKFEERNMVKEYCDENAESFFFVPPEGHVAMFPSKLSHCTEAMIDDFNGERLALVGDITLTLKEEHLHYSMGYIDPKYWKMYS